MMSDEQVRSDFLEILADTLGVDEEELTPKARFFADLGGESIDILELSFRCEKHFGIKVEFQKIAATEGLEVNERNELAPESLKRLKAELPFLELSEFERNPSMTDVSSLLTVEALVGYMAWSLREATGQGGTDSSASPGVLPA